MYCLDASGTRIRRFAIVSILIEDTVVFPAWKETLTADALDEMNEKFEEIEHEQFGEDGFESALKQMAEIEQDLGLSDLAQFTAPPPPAAK